MPLGILFALSFLTFETASSKFSKLSFSVSSIIIAFVKPMQWVGMGREIEPDVVVHSLVLELVIWLVGVVSAFDDVCRLGTI